MSVAQALLLDRHDNVAVALAELPAGTLVETGGLTVRTVEPIPQGHKLSLREIAADEPVVKYGSPIGHATQAIAAGAHVHVHNVASARLRGDA